MNTLPMELEDIICEYTHQLKMNGVLDELCQSFSQCDYCRDDKPQIHLAFCQCCSIEFCSDCQSCLADNRGKYCDGCFYEQMAFGEIETTLGRKFEGDELTNVMDLFDTIEDEDEKENICDYIRYLRHRATTMSFKKLMSFIQGYLEL